MKIQALKDCDLKPADIGRIILVGIDQNSFSSKALQQFFGRRSNGSLCESDET